MSKKKMKPVLSLKNVKIATLILTLVIVAIIAIGTMSGLGIYNMRELNKDMVSLYNDRMIPSIQAEEMYSGFLKIRINANRILNGYSETYSQEIKTTDKTIRDNIKKYEESYITDDERKILEDFKNNYEEYMKLWNSYEGKIKNDYVLSTSEINTFIGISDKVDQALTSLVEYNINYSEQIVSESNDRFKATQNFFIIVLVVIAFVFIVSAYVIISIVRRFMNNTNSILHKLSQYDFNVEIDTEGKNEFANMNKSLMQVVKNMREAIEQVKGGAQELTENADSLSATSEEMASSSQEVASTIQQVAEGASSQASELSAVVNLIADLTNNIDNIYTHLRTVKEETENTVDKANSGKMEMDILIKSIEEIRKAFVDVTDKINNLTDSINQISSITEVITGISEQTNLLALNAAIEAARAGEMGKGFAVVADEVRKLAEDSKKSTDEIVRLINSIYSETNEVNKTTKEVEAYIKSQADSVEKAVTSFGDVLSSIDAVAPLIENTYEAMDNTVQAKDKVIEKVEMVSAVTEENSASSEEVAASAEELSAASEEVASTAQVLNGMAKKLTDIVERFKL